MIKRKLIEQMELFDYDKEMIEKLSNDRHALKWIKHLIDNGYVEKVEDLFEDAGFHEFLQLQYENPISFEDMI